MKSKAAFLKRALGECLTKAGFVRKSDTWYYRADETILLVNLQKSNYGDQYYVNLGVWVKKLGEATWPKVNHCQVGLRADDLASEADAITTVLDLEDKSLSDEDRCRRLVALMEEKAIPFLLSLGSLEGIRSAIEGGRLRNALVYAKVRDLVGLPLKESDRKPHNEQKRDIQVLRVVIVPRSRGHAGTEKPKGDEQG